MHHASCRLQQSLHSLHIEFGVRKTTRTRQWPHKANKACARESSVTSHLRLHAESQQLPTTCTRQSAQVATHSRPKPDRCPTRKTSSAAQTSHNAFMNLQCYRLQQTQHLQRCVAHTLYTCNASATAAFDGARTDMHLPSFKWQLTQHILQLRPCLKSWRLKE